MAATAGQGAFEDISRLEPRRSPRRRWFRPWRLVGLTVTAALVGGAAFVLWVIWDLPRLDLSKPPTDRAAIVLEAADGSPIAKSGGHYSGPAVRDELPGHLVEAVLAIEDRRFYEHQGLDPFSIMRAAWRNYSAGDIVQGGSTIPQQLAKILFLDPEKTYRRKLQEAVIATWLDTRLSKDEILVKYLDSVYFGAGATGIDAAAEVYFDREVADLDLAQSAMLAGLIRAPSRLNPIANPDAAQERTTLVLEAMVEAGFIAREKAIEVALDPARPVRTAAFRPTGSWFGDWAHGEAVAALGQLGGAARIRTTLDPELQALGERVVRSALDREGARQDVGQAALVAMAHDGAVLAMVGGRSYEASQFNRAVDARRQAGSAFKVFVYMAALKAGMDPESVIVDEPIDIGGWRPENYSGRYFGEVTLQQALARSLNAATVGLAADLGIEAVIAAAHELGIDAELQPTMTLALGTAGIGLLDLTGAYASIAAGRAPIEPWGIAGVSAEAGGEPVMFEREQRNAHRLEHGETMISMLETVVREGTGKRAAIEDAFVAGKTGTSQEHRDGWFVGFTDKLVVGVWVGNDDNSPTKEVTGGGLPAQIWREFVTRATGAEPAEDAPADDEVEDGPPVADDGGEAERDFAGDEASPPAEADVAAEETAAPPEEEIAVEEDAPPPEEEVAVEEQAAPTEEELAAEESAPPPEVVEEPVAIVEEPTQEAPPEPKPAVAGSTGQPEPLALIPPSNTAEDLARNRAIAEELTRRRRGGAGIDNGPQILLGGRGLQ
jgi:1A family penicillin-binding protein